MYSKRLLTNSTHKEQAMKRLLLILLPILLLTACEENSNTAQKELLIGSWIFESGTKDNSVDGTELLNKLVFTFSETEFECDLLPDMMQGMSKKETYELKDNSIIINEKLNLELKEITKDNLLVKFEILLNDTPTEFDLKFKSHQVQ